MSAKKKAADKNVGSYVEPNKDPELEKKIDAMLSVEDLPPPEKLGDTPELPEKDPKPLLQVTDTPASDVPPPVAPAPVAATPPATGGAPLLPSEKLPDLGKKKQIAVKIDEDEKLPEPVVPPKEETSESVVPEKPVEPVTTPEPAEKIEPAEPLLEDESVPAPADELGLEEQSTSKAVDDIVAQEADELLAAHDGKIAAAAAPEPVAKPRKGFFKRFFGAWWHSKPARNFTILLVLLGFGAAAAYPASRYYVLNAAGVRASSSVTVLDLTNNQPLKNATFSIGDVSAKTDGEGRAEVTGLRLGPSSMKINKPAFADVSQPVTIGWGSNPLGEFKVKATGVQYKFNLTDFVTKEKIAKAEASSGQADARSDDKGELVLTIPRTELEEMEVNITAENYRNETIKLPTNKTETTDLQMVPSKKHVFVTKRSGKFDVYKIDVDGKNEERVLAGTGSERSEAMALSVHPTRDVAALVSSRENAQNKDGFNLSTLTLINLSDNQPLKAAQSERIQLIDWIGNKLVYVKIGEGESAASPNRHRLIAYDIDSKTERELASTNYFNDVISVNGAIYYSPAQYQVNGQVGLYKINAEGNNRKMIYEKEVWNLFRTSYDKLSVSMGQDWFELNLANDNLTKAGGAPPVLKSRVYYDSPDAAASLWVDDRDGKGVLLSYGKDSKEDKVLQTLSGLKNPLRWLDSKHFIFRVSTSQETADYVAGLSGEPIKVRDVTDTGGIDR